MDSGDIYLAMAHGHMHGLMSNLPMKYCAHLFMAVVEPDQARDNDPFQAAVIDSIIDRIY